MISSDSIVTMTSILSDGDVRIDDSEIGSADSTRQSSTSSSGTDCSRTETNKLSPVSTPNAANKQLRIEQKLTDKSASLPDRKEPNIELKGSTISFHQLHYAIDIKPPGKKCGTVSKEILHNVSGLFLPGVNAILGPTGSGKTTLLDILAGRKERKGLAGQVLVDGCKQPKNFKCVTGYVVQDDVIMGTLTVRENLMFSANLRLPNSVSKEMKVVRVEETISELGLTSCADSKVGTPFLRGVSGGERKRTNIGMELIISSNILFLDEPTTGLDASTAGAVIELLHNLSRKNRTIIFVIHQPRYAIFRLFDRLMLLAEGQTIFHGKASDALPFFSSIGYVCDEYNNPPDFFMDVINKDFNTKHIIHTPLAGANTHLASSSGGSSTSLVSHKYTMTIELVHGCVHDNHSTTKNDNHTAVISACMVELQAEQPKKKKVPTATLR